MSSPIVVQIEFSKLNDSFMLAIVNAAKIKSFRKLFKWLNDLLFISLSMLSSTVQSIPSSSCAAAELAIKS